MNKITDSILFVMVSIVASIIYIAAYIFGGKEWREWLKDEDHD
jgi:hypothetical protein